MTGPTCLKCDKPASGNINSEATPASLPTTNPPTLALLALLKDRQGSPQEGGDATTDSR